MHERWVKTSEHVAATTQTVSDLEATHFFLMICEHFEGGVVECAQSGLGGEQPVQLGAGRAVLEDAQGALPASPAAGAGGDRDVQAAAHADDDGGVSGA